MKLTTITPKYLDEIPKDIKEGILYISRMYDTATHLCACGCGQKTVTPLVPENKVETYPRQWYLRGTYDKPTLEGSILNPVCESHYFIREGNIVWD